MNYLKSWVSSEDCCFCSFGIVVVGVAAVVFKRRCLTEDCVPYWSGKWAVLPKNKAPFIVGSCRKTGGQRKDFLELHEKPACDCLMINGCTFGRISCKTCIHFCVLCGSYCQRPEYLQKGLATFNGQIGLVSLCPVPWHLLLKSG